MMFSLAAMNWLEIAIRPMAATTEVMPSSSGIEAATSDPSTIIRMMIVSGIEIRPAFASPPLISASIAFSVDVPTDSTVKPGWRASTLSMAATMIVDVEDGLLVGALRRVGDHRRVAVLRDQVGVAGVERRAHLRGLRERAERVLDVLDDRGAERRVGRL